MKNEIKVGDLVMGESGTPSAGHAGIVYEIKYIGRHRYAFYRSDEGYVFMTLVHRLTKNVPEKGKFPRKNPINRFDKTLQRYHGGDDPSRQEMIEHIKGVYGREADRFDIEEAIYWFSNDYHGGQGSNLYSALSKSEYRPGRISSGPEEGSMAEMIYTDLVDTFSPKKNPVLPRKGESERKFVSRCMSEEKMSFPKTKQRIAVCLSKSRKRNPVYDTGSDE